MKHRLVASSVAIIERLLYMSKTKAAIIFQRDDKGPAFELTWRLASNVFIVYFVARTSLMPRHCLAATYKIMQCDKQRETLSVERLLSKTKGNGTSFINRKKSYSSVSIRCSSPVQNWYVAAVFTTDRNLKVFPLIICQTSVNGTQTYPLYWAFIAANRAEVKRG